MNPVLLSPLAETLHCTLTLYYILEGNSEMYICPFTVQMSREVRFLFKRRGMNTDSKYDLLE